MSIASVLADRTPVRPKAVSLEADGKDRADAPADRNPTRAEFSALLALLANAGPQVRNEVLAQVPKGNASLIDRLLDAAVEGEGDSEAINAEQIVGDHANAGRAADALRYGILMDMPGNGAAVPASAGSHDDVTAPIANPHAHGDPQRSPTVGLTRALENVEDHERAREVLSRIVARNGAAVDQLKARGDTRAAEVRMMLDTILSQAGTPTGRELADTPETTANSAAALALASANARSASAVDTPIRDTEALSPELRQKLGRVIERMKAEYGHDVGIVETARSQERQDHLFEQGRTRPGAVVTWTRDSAHTRGEAVDVTIDGSWSNAAGFARLQSIAREEGLRTLGAKDPGHLELVSGTRMGATGDAGMMAAAQRSQSNAQSATQATSAQQAGVARVAGVASAAGVARIAEPGVGRGASRALALGDDARAASASAPMVAGSLPDQARGRGFAFGRDAREDGQRSASATPRTANESTGVESAVFGATPGAVTSGSTPVHAAPHAAGVNAAERVADAQALRENAPAGVMSRVVLNVDAPNGGQDRITIDVRGNSVGTQISTDAANADRLRLQTADLQDALTRHGLDGDSVRIASASRTEGTDPRLLVAERDAMRTVAAQQASAGDSNMQHQQRERAATAREWDRQDASRQARDEQERSDREQGRQHASRDGGREPYNRSST